MFILLTLAKNVIGFVCGRERVTSNLGRAKNALHVIFYEATANTIISVVC
jgi:hypothetical protein